MKAILSIVAGLIVGVVVAGLLLGGILAFTPEPPPPSAADPSITIPTSTPSAAASVAPSASPSAAASVTPSASPSAAASVTPSASPSAAASLTPSAAAAPFHVGQPAPSLVVPQAGDGTIDLATFLPGIDVTT